MNIALWFPFLYFLKQTKYGQKASNTVKAWWHRIKHACRTKCYCDVDDESARIMCVNKQKIQMDVEYMSLVSSLEIVIVFGWAVPLLVVLYGITMFGYWCVYWYRFSDPYTKFVNRR
eukprot:CAMPEP_0197047122 /NCGR_PEP_ID=MMETSP1384-20130603/22673_1 /TAXON_ID=29189 /ORGANISM="Ammonia sp." /LENGTH=116 /DNA_ID=CAMNT_0042478995 /DNA_START=168 /DNA_END=515 /DNA_ORIENTATION=-